MIYYFLQSEYKNGLLEVQNNLDSALWSHPYETRMIKTQFLFKNQCQQGNLQVLVPGTANASFMKQSQNKRRRKKKIKKKNSKCNSQHPHSSSKGKKSITKFQRHSSSWPALHRGSLSQGYVWRMPNSMLLICPDGEVVALDKEIFLDLRRIHLVNFVRTLLLSEKKAGTITTLCVSSFQILVLQARTGLIVN